MDYYFQEQIRWTLGFENPNKAGALVASGLPLLWIVWRLAGKVTARGWRMLAMLLAGLALGAGWWVLFKTYSRGGIVAAGVAFGYLGWCSFKTSREARPGAWLAPLILAGVIAGLFLTTSAAQRSTQWIGQREGSVENRLTLWKGGLQMIAAVPQGVGRGQSGEFYLQWFQPLEHPTRYRTLVNSYLTFTAERGLGALALVTFGALLVWPMGSVPDTSPRRMITVAGCRATLLAFAGAGFFSTTMEERLLWILPVAALAVLLGISLWQRPRVSPLRGLPAATAGALALSAALGLAGGWLNRHDAVQISLAGETVTLTPAHPSRPPLQVLLDREVLGRNYGKLLRRLAIQQQSRIFIPPSGSAISGGGMVLASGDTVQQDLRGVTKLVLLAPAIPSESAARQLLASDRPTLLLLPEVDEDGRGSFWKALAAESLTPPTTLQQETLEGVGLHVEWAWEQVLHALQLFSSS